MEIFDISGPHSHPLWRLRWNFTQPSGLACPSVLQSLTWIGTTSRPCGVKTLILGLWVSALRHPAGNNNNNAHWNTVSASQLPSCSTDMSTDSDSRLQSHHNIVTTATSCCLPACCSYWPLDEKLRKYYENYRNCDFNKLCGRPPQ